MKVVIAFVALCVVAVIAAPAPAELMEENQVMGMGQENNLMSVDAEPKGDSAIPSTKGRAKRFILFGGYYPYYYPYHYVIG